MKIISYNVNGIRSAISKGFLEWIQQANPDIICLQEIKAQEAKMKMDMMNPPIKDSIAPATK